jgi:FAD-dependent urate hydroxylase
MTAHSSDCNVTIIGAGPYGLASAAYLRAAGVESRVFGEPMSFWEKQMPVGMCLRSNWGASHIADPKHELTLDAYCRENGNHVGKPIPIERFIDYGRWFQRKAVPNVERKTVVEMGSEANGFKIRLEDGEQFRSRRVIIATGISSFTSRPTEFSPIPSALASHTSEHSDLRKFRGQRVAIIGGGQSALESAALLKESGAEVEVIVRQPQLNWVGLHAKLHRLGLISSFLYSKRDVGPAGISRLVAAPHVFRLFPRGFQNRTAYRAIRPAGAGWLRPRLTEVPISLGRRVISAKEQGSRVRLQLDDHSERLVDHALLATGFRVDVSRYGFLGPSVVKQLKTVNGYPVLKRGLESSIPGLHFIGKPAAWSFGPLLGFVSGAEFASTEVLRHIANRNGH